MSIGKKNISWISGYDCYVWKVFVFFISNSIGTVWPDFLYWSRRTSTLVFFPYKAHRPSSWNIWPNLHHLQGLQYIDYIPNPITVGSTPVSSNSSPFPISDILSPSPCPSPTIAFLLLSHKATPSSSTR